MSVGSVLRYRNYCIREAQGRANPEAKLELRLKSPIQGAVVLREVASDIYTFGDVFEHQVYKKVLLHIPKCSTIIDLGANIGLASRYLASAYPSARIFAVEPNQENLELMRTNLKDLIRENRCVIVQAAVWSSRKTLTADPEWLPGAYNAYRLRERPARPNALAGVQGLTMQEILIAANFPQVDLLKVDVEGAETELFKNDLSWLDCVGAIAIEFHGQSRCESAFDRKLTEHRFKVCEDDSHTVLAIRDNLSR
jgi:FkbM family methyltransferase